MSSNQDNNNTNNNGNTASVIPLVVPASKKKSSKPKMRVRPKMKPKKATGGTSSVSVTGGTTTTGTDNTTSLKRKADSDDNKNEKGTEAIQVTQKIPSVDATNNTITTTTTSTNKKKILPRKPTAVKKVLRPIRKASSGIKIGSSKKGIQIGASRKNNVVATTNTSTTDDHQGVNSKESTETVTPTLATTTTTDSQQILNNTNTADSAQITITQEPTETEIIPYQHLGQLDPCLNIAPPKPEEQTMKDFCSKFKIPKELRKVEEQNSNATTIDNNNNNNNNTTHTTQEVNPPTTTTTQEEQDTRSGPLVEIINGEIVIKESSMIVGARRTTEEVDKELEGEVVIEDSTGLQATYTSFTKRQKVLRWTTRETKKFYKALRQCGTDFSTMENFFDGSDELNVRTRKELKSKYKRECRQNLHLIDMAMDPSKQLPLDLTVFGDLDMNAVETVVPLGEAVVRVAAGEQDSSVGGDQNGVAATATATVDATATPVEGTVDATEGEPEVVVEVMGEENQDMTHQDTSAPNSNSITAAPAAAVTVEKPSETVEKVSAIPLLAPAAKKKARAKFRMKPKAKPKAKAKTKKAVATKK